MLAFLYNTRLGEYCGGAITSGVKDPSDPDRSQESPKLKLCLNLSIFAEMFCVVTPSPAREPSIPRQVLGDCQNVLRISAGANGNFFSRP